MANVFGRLLGFGSSFNKAQGVGGDNIQIGANSRDITVLLSRPDYQVEELGISDRRRLDPKSCPPSYLLDVQHEIVPFFGRSNEMHLLEGWLNSRGPVVSLKLISGPGGRGKTRLARRLASLAQASGWQVGQASEVVAGRSTVSHLDQSRSERPVLLVVDYADRWPLSRLVALIEDFAYQPRKVRILLVARDGAAFWKDLKADLPGSEFEIADRLKLGPLSESPLSRQQAYNEAVAAFAEAMNVTIKKISALENVDHEVFDSPLTLHMAALAEVCAKRDREDAPGKDDLSEFLLKHERRYWNKVRETFIADQRVHPVTRSEIHRFIALATLIGPANLDDITYACEASCLFEGGASVRELCELHLAIYPDYPAPKRQDLVNSISLPEPIVSPVRPDRLGEDLVGEALSDSFFVEAVLRLGGTDLPKLLKRRLLAAASAASSRHSAAASLLLELFRRNLSLVDAASSETLAQLARFGSTDLLARIYEQLPELSIDVNRGAMLIGERLLQGGVESIRRSSLLMDLSLRATATGELDIALASAEEALALARSAIPRDNNLLARSLHCLSLRLADLGRYEEAIELTEEAIGLYRDATGDAPLSAVNYATALAHLSICYGRLDRVVAAVPPIREAVGIHRTLATVLPEDFMSTLATSLGTLSARLSSVGDQDGCIAALEESLQIRRRLSSEDPHRYLPDLCKSLTNYAGTLAAAGRMDDAINASREAVVVARDLVAHDSVAFLPALARALHSVAFCCGSAWNQAEGIQASEEAISIVRPLADRYPEVHLPLLGAVLMNLARLLSGDETHEQQLNLTREALNIFHTLSVWNPAHGKADLAAALHNFASVRNDLHIELDDAFAAAAESMRIYVDLSGRLPKKYNGDLYNAFALSADLCEKMGNKGLARQLRSVLPEAKVVKSDGGRRRVKKSERSTRAQARRKRRLLGVDPPPLPYFDKKTFAVDLESPDSPFNSPTNFAELERIASNTVADAVFKISGDPELGKHEWSIEPDQFSSGLRIGDGDSSLRYPVALFEFRRAVFMADRSDGGAYEVQVRAICQSGFGHLAAGVTLIPKLPGWQLVYSGSGTKLFDGEGGLWAETEAIPDSAWIDLGQTRGAAIVLFGIKLGVVKPEAVPENEYDSVSRARELKKSRSLGFVAAAVIPLGPIERIGS